MKQMTPAWEPAPAAVRGMYLKFEYFSSFSKVRKGGRIRHQTHSSHNLMIMSLKCLKNLLLRSKFLPYPAAFPNLRETREIF